MVGSDGGRKGGWARYYVVVDHFQHANGLVLTWRIIFLPMSTG